MNDHKWIRTLPLSLVAIACTVVAAKLAVENKPYGWFLVMGFVIAWWVRDLLEKSAKE